MDPITQQTTLAAAGGKKDPVYVDDVFSTFLYDGTSSALTITNGIDLSGEGGLVWTKRRNIARSHILFDSERGTSSRLMTDSTNYAANQPYSITMNSDGYAWSGTDNDVNVSGSEYCSWTFRKAPGFFDVVTWTGNGTGQTISHNLGSVPGSIWVKQLNFNRDWWCYHRGTDATNPSHYILNLNKSDARTDHGAFNDTEPTSTSFTLSSAGEVNGNGDTYVAYIFAHDDQSFGKNGDESIIKCGSYTGTGSANFVNLGFEPQFIIIKRSSASEDWLMFDNMRGLVSGGIDSDLRPNQNQLEGRFLNYLEPNPNGFTLIDNNNRSNNSGDTYIYIAIRRPHKPPSAGTEVFAVDNNDTGHSANRPSFISNFPVDLLIRRNQIDNSDTAEFGTRLINRIQNIVYTDSSNDAGTSTFPYNNGVYNLSNVRATDYVWMFKRAPGFLDIVAYTGNGVQGRQITHGLGVKPEMMIVKRWNGSDQYRVYHKGIADAGYSGMPASYGYLRFSDVAYVASNQIWSNTEPTSSVFTVHDDDTVNRNNETYISFLFATIPGVSKVGSYSGSNADLTIDCGFTNGARFVMIKSINSTTDWWIIDTTRGINSGTDPALAINTNNAQLTTADFIDPHSSGFIAQTGLAAVNVSGTKYIFLAIA